MLRAISKRLAHLIIVVWLVSLATFFLLDLVPGDPAVAILGANGTPEQYAQIREELGMNKSLRERYVDWIGGIVHGDFGNSLVPPHQSVADELLSRLPVTMEIAVAGLLLGLVLSVPLGVWSAYRVGERFDRISSTAVFALMSLPTFLAGLLVVQLFIFRPEIARGGIGLIAVAIIVMLAVKQIRSRSTDLRMRNARLITGLVVGLLAAALVIWWPTLPRQGFSRLTDGAGIGANLLHVILPALTIALGELALFTRVLRAEMINTLDADFVLAARAKGMPTFRILTREALRPASFSLITVAGLSLGRLLGGTLIVEVIFNLPGIGRLLVESIQVNDYVTVQAGVLVLALIYVVVNATVDGLYSVLDPRVRHDS